MTDALRNDTGDDTGDEIDLAEILERAKEARAAVDVLTRSATDTLRTANAVVRRQIDEHPAATLGIAAGVGFVVAGGLATPAARAFLKMGTRVALAAALRQVLVEAKRRSTPRDGHQAQAEGAAPL